MRRFLNVILITAMLFCSISCEKNDPLPSAPILGLGGENWAAGMLDTWLGTHFVTPYNIEVKYKWDPYEVNYRKNIVPVMEEKVIPVMTAVDEIWVKPFEAVGGSTFFKTYAPKQFILAGSAEYNSDGTIILGQAEGGRKILLMVVNEFDPKKFATVKQMMHTIIHEFSHILHQSRLYPVEWKTLNPERYTATWYNSTDAQANVQGLVTAYAKSNSDEDFVETITVLLLDGQEYYNTLIANTPVSSAAIFREKERIIVEYFKREYQMDFKQLQQQTKLALDKYK